MSKFLDQLTEHTDKLSLDLVPIEVPEIGETIYYRRSWTLAARTEVQALYRDNKSTEALALTFILRAVDAEGKPLMTKIEVRELMRRVDGDLIAAAVAKMTNDDAEHAAAVGKSPS